MPLEEGEEVSEGWVLQPMSSVQVMLLVLVYSFALSSKLTKLSQKTQAEYHS